MTDNEGRFYCGRFRKEFDDIKKIISEKREIDSDAGNGVIRRNATTLFKDNQILKHIYLRVEKSKLVREKLLDLLSGEERTNIEAIYQLYGDFDFCVELQGCNKDVKEIEEKIIYELKNMGQLLHPRGKLKNPLVRDYLDFHKLYGIERDEIKKGVYFIDFEKTNSIGVFVHVNMGDHGVADATAIYSDIKERLNKRNREAFLYSVSYSEQPLVLWFMLLAECGEYYQLNEVSDIIDDAVEEYGIKKTTYPIAGFIHNDINNAGFKMAINYKGNGKDRLDGKNAPIVMVEVADDQMVFDVFLAHNTVDQSEVVDLILNPFKQNGLKPWFDKDGKILFGQNVCEKIAEALLKSKCIAFICGNSGIGKWQRQEELSMIRSVANLYHKPVGIVWLPSCLEETRIQCKSQLLDIIANKYIDLKDNYKEGINDFISDIIKI